MKGISTTPVTRERGGPSETVLESPSVENGLGRLGSGVRDTWPELMVVLRLLWMAGPGFGHQAMAIGSTRGEMSEMCTRWARTRQERVVSIDKNRRFIVKMIRRENKREKLTRATPPSIERTPRDPSTAGKMYQPPECRREDVAQLEARVERNVQPA